MHGQCIKTRGGNLLERYRPWTLGEVRGQPQALRILQSYLLDIESTPYSQSFLFHGPTGVGKTCTALALAYDLGCSKDDAEIGGIIEIPSGQQDGTAVKDVLNRLRLRPMFGSGWKVCLVNEADFMTKSAEAIWLDGLDSQNLPVNTVFVFSTNDTRGISDRFKGRCEPVEFHGAGQDLHDALNAFVSEIWERETGQPLDIVPENLGKFDLASGSLSFRLALQQIAPYIRAGDQLPESFDAPFMRQEAAMEFSKRSAGAKKAWKTRRETVLN